MTGHRQQELCVHIVNLTRQSSDRRTLVVVVPYAIRAKDQCWSRKWGGHKRGKATVGRGSSDSKSRKSGGLEGGHNRGEVAHR